MEIPLERGKRHPVETFLMCAELDPSILAQLTYLEEIFYERELSTVEIAELVHLCGRAIEYFDSVRHPMKTYFEDKIKFILSRKEVLELIMQNNPERDSFVGIMMREYSEFECEDELRSSFVRIDRLAPQPTEFIESADKMSETSILSKKLEDGEITRRKMEHDFMLHKEMQEKNLTDIKSVKTIVTKFEQSADEAAVVVEENLDLEFQDFLNRNERRKRTKDLKVSCSLSNLEALASREEIENDDLGSPDKENFYLNSTENTNDTEEELELQEEEEEEESII